MSIRRDFEAAVASAYRRFGVTDGSCVAVAFSGGADSVALLAATMAAGYRAVALHCNFHLRGDESDRDEAFARRMASDLGCIIKVVDFDVEARRATTGESVEMACRWLRYDWFERQFAAASGSWGCVAVAHHADDNVETFFLNLMRGTGLRGLCAIPQRRGIYVRPLLGVSRNDVLAYLNACGLDYVVDSTNLSCDYRRNFLRNKVLPLMHTVFPALRKSVSCTISNLQRDSELLESLVAGVASKCTDADGRVDLHAVAAHPFADSLLFHILNAADSGCSYSLATARAMLNGVEKSGLTFHADKGDGGYLLDRGKLVPLSVADFNAIASVGANEIVCCDDEIEITEAMLDGIEPLPSTSGGLHVERMPLGEFRPSRNAGVLWVDAAKLVAAMASGDKLVLRHWRSGDRITPFGMKGSRLVSDIFNDAKVSRADKSRTWLLVCGERILWVPGLRASSHFPVDNATHCVLKFSLNGR